MTPPNTQLERRRLVLGLNDTRRVGSRELAEIERAFGSIEALRRPCAGTIGKIASLSRGLAKALREESLESRGERVEAALEACCLRVSIVGEDDFPDGLMALANPPLALIYRGTLPIGGQRRVAIVGARQSTRYGKRMANRLARDLASMGVEITSGLARGVDREAHAGTLAAGGVTHGILGCGLPRIYPAEHASLAEEMANLGSVICEFSPGTPPLPGNFPRRNRIIAALCDALILVEAKAKSGGLITVRWASDLGRSVFVSPGQVDNPASAGCLALIRDGVTMIRDAQDLMDDLRWPRDGLDPSVAENEIIEKRALPKMTAAEERLLACLDHEPIPLDALLPALDQTPGQVLTGLLALELKGLVLQEAGMRFRRA